MESHRKDQPQMNKKFGDILNKPRRVKNKSGKNEKQKDTMITRNKKRKRHKMNKDHKTDQDEELMHLMRTRKKKKMTTNSECLKKRK